MARVIDRPPETTKGPVKDPFYNGMIVENMPYKSAAVLQPQRLVRLVKGKVEGPCHTGVGNLFIVDIQPF